MRRAVIIASSVVGALLLLALALVVAVLIIGNTDSGRTLIARLTAQWTSGQVRLAGLNGSFPSALNLERLELADEHGVWLSAERVSLRWSPWALLERDVRIDSLTVARLHIERRPVTSSAPSKSSSFSIPHIDVTTASVDTLELGAELAGVPASLTVRASAHLRSLEDASAKLNARRTN
ncbi:MAG TPA: hypothetical protein VNU73_10540, partial [Steroidobacteraceae bacterium]|nr:hypothetical protein [Steroidobacteraceae bacterium]